MALVHLGDRAGSPNSAYNPYDYGGEVDLYETRAVTPEELASATNQINRELAADVTSIIEYGNVDELPKYERIAALHAALPEGNEYVPTGDDSGFWRVRRSKLALTENERRWEQEHRDDKVIRARRNGDDEAANLRVMMNYARSGAEDARSIGDVKELAWQLRNNRDIALAKKVAGRLAEKEGRDVHWSDVIVPTTVGMVTYGANPDVVPDVSGGPVKMRNMSIAEAVARDINEKASAEQYGNLTTYNQAEYLAARYGLRPVMDEYREIDPVYGSPIGRPVSIASGRYEVDPDWGKKRPEYLSDREQEARLAAAHLDSRYQSLVENLFSGYAPDPSVVWDMVSSETLTPEFYRDYPDIAGVYQDYLDKKLGRYTPPAPGAELAEKWRTQWEWNPWNRPVSERDRRDKQARFERKYRKTSEPRTAPKTAPETRAGKVWRMLTRPGYEVISDLLKGAAR